MVWLGLVGQLLESGGPTIRLENILNHGEGGVPLSSGGYAFVLRNKISAICIYLCVSTGKGYVVTCILEKKDMIFRPSSNEEGPVVGGEAVGGAAAAAGGALADVCEGVPDEGERVVRILGHRRLEILRPHGEGIWSDFRPIVSSGAKIRLLQTTGKGG